MRTEKEIWDIINNLTPKQVREFKWKLFELTPEQQEALHYKAFPPKTISTHSVDGVPVDDCNQTV